MILSSAGKVNPAKQEGIIMSKKIVILNGSPRKKGNTSALVRAFTQGTESSGHTVAKFFLDSMNIHGCKGCFGGHSNRECPCVQQNDMNKIYPAVRDCGVIVFASSSVHLPVING